MLHQVADGGDFGIDWREQRGRERLTQTGSPRHTGRTLSPSSHRGSSSMGRPISTAWHRFCMRCWRVTALHGRRAGVIAKRLSEPIPDLSTLRQVPQHRLATSRGSPKSLRPLHRWGSSLPRWRSQIDDRSNTVAWAVGALGVADHSSGAARGSPPKESKTRW